MIRARYPSEGVESKGVPASMWSGARSRGRGRAALEQARVMVAPARLHKLLPIAATTFRVGPANFTEAMRRPVTPL